MNISYILICKTSLAQQCWKVNLATRATYHYDNLIYSNIVPMQSQVFIYVSKPTVLMKQKYSVTFDRVHIM